MSDGVNGFKADAVNMKPAAIIQAERAEPLHPAPRYQVKTAARPLRPSLFSPLLYWSPNKGGTSEAGTLGPQLWGPGTWGQMVIQPHNYAAE